MFLFANTVIAEIFVRVKISYSSVRELSYAINFRTARAVSQTLLYVAWFSYATKFRTFRQKYEIYEIKSRTKISAITVETGSAFQTNGPRTEKHFNPEMVYGRQ